MRLLLDHCSQQKRRGVFCPLFTTRNTTTENASDTSIHSSIEMYFNCKNHRSIVQKYRKRRSRTLRVRNCASFNAPREKFQQKFKFSFHTEIFPKAPGSCKRSRKIHLTAGFPRSDSHSHTDSTPCRQGKTKTKLTSSSSSYCRFLHRPFPFTHTTCARLQKSHNTKKSQDARCRNWCSARPAAPQYAPSCPSGRGSLLLPLSAGTTENRVKQTDGEKGTPAIQSVINSVCKLRHQLGSDRGRRCVDA